MIGWLRPVAAELGKIRRGPLPPVVVISPYLVILAFGLFTWLEGERFLGSASVSSWSWINGTTMNVWCLVVLPVMAALVSAQVAAIEHRNRGLQHIFALPLSRWRFYCGKFAVVFLLITASFLLLGIGVLLTGSILGALRPELAFGPIPWPEIVQTYSRALLACPFFLSIQLWVALMRKDFIAPIGLAVIALILVMALRSLGSEWDLYHPWAYPALAIAAETQGQGQGLIWPTLGTLGALLFTFPAAYVFLSRDLH